MTLLHLIFRPNFVCESSALDHPLLTLICFGRCAILNVADSVHCCCIVIAVCPPAKTSCVGCNSTQTCPSCSGYGNSTCDTLCNTGYGPNTAPDSCSRKLLRYGTLKTCFEVVLLVKALKYQTIICLLLLNRLS